MLSSRVSARFALLLVLAMPGSIPGWMPVAGAEAQVVGAGESSSGASGSPGTAPVPATPEVAPEEPAPPAGKVLFSRDGDAAAEAAPAAVATEDAGLKVSDAEREALTFTRYDLDVHLKPADAGISVRAGLTVRNDGKVALVRLPLQLSSSLRWDSLSAVGPEGAVPLPFVVHGVFTHIDHTGKVQEAVVTLAKPLEPGASLALNVLYSGAIAPSAERLEQIGAPAVEAIQADWDAIATTGTGLRGFGNVIWYPVASTPVFLGDGARLFQAIGRDKLRQSGATVRLRLAIEYAGDAPDAAFFCGERQALVAVSDNPNLPIAEGVGVATAEFKPRVLGFRSPSLFVTDRAATETDGGLIAAVTDHYDALPSYGAAAEMVRPLMTDWLGPAPLQTLSILDHPGQPFEEDALLVRPLRASDAATLAPSLAHSLTHAWFRSNRAWIDEGLAQFMAVLWTERSAGRAAALTQLQDAATGLAVAEPETPGDGAGESLDAATTDVFYRTKAAAVWWMLRGLVGDEALKQALQAYRTDATADRESKGLELELERVSEKDLRWFFDDWVYRDRGLPDLTIVAVSPRQIEALGGRPAGWLVAVDVRNDGYAAADVPVTVRSAGATVTERLRIAGRSSASIRIVYAGTPEQVLVNDGSIPEVRGSIHMRELVLTRH